jgi:hypothetical protein
VEPVDSTIATRITVGFHVDSVAVKERLPEPWTTPKSEGDPNDAVNLTLIFSDALLNQSGLGDPAPDETSRSLIFLLPAVHPETEERASFVFRIFTSHPEGVPGKYANSLQASVKRESRSESLGLETRVSELLDLSAPDGGRMELRLRYLRNPPEREKRESTVRSTDDPSIARLYRSDELSDVLLDVVGGIDRIQYYEFRSTVGELSDLFDGSERVLTIKVSPWYVRDVFPG